MIISFDFFISNNRISGIWFNLMVVKNKNLLNKERGCSIILPAPDLKTLKNFTLSALPFNKFV